MRVLFSLALLVFVVAISLAPSWTQWPLTNRPLRWFSEISYSVLLYQFRSSSSDSSRSAPAANHGSLWLWTAAVLRTPIAIGTLSYFVIERPSLPAVGAPSSDP